MSKRFRDLGALKSENYLERFEVYKLGHSIIDAEHKKLLHDMELVCKLVVRQDIPELIKAMNQLEATMSEHFRHEEKLMTDARYTFVEWHRTIHLAIEKDFKATMANYLASANRFSAEFAFASAMEAYIVRHIDEQDRQFVDFLESQPTVMGVL
jgi:hemerythrin-like metal-binding protein